MLELIGTAASAILGGGATGILGAAVQRYADYKGRQLDLQAQASKQAHEVAMREADARIMAQEWAARTQVATIEGLYLIQISEPPRLLSNSYAVFCLKKTNRI